MEFKNWMKGFGTYLFAEILCLFLALTLSAVGGGLFRLISCICTIAVLICLCVNYAYNRAVADRKSKVPDTMARRFFLSLSVGLPFFLLGILLLLAKAGVLPAGFYRWYKLLDAPFLQLCNLLCKEITAAALSWTKAAVLGLGKSGAVCGCVGDLYPGAKRRCAGGTAIPKEIRSIGENDEVLETGSRCYGSNNTVYGDSCVFSGAADNAAVSAGGGCGCRQQHHHCRCIYNFAVLCRAHRRQSDFLGRTAAQLNLFSTYSARTAHRLYQIFCVQEE